MIKNKIILITGTSKGIGRYLSSHYAKKGWEVIGCSRKQTDLEAGNYLHFCLDVSDEIKVKQMFSEIRKKYARLDVVINNAGVMAKDYLILTSLKSVTNVIRTNFIGSFVICREAIKLMKKNQFGRIVNISTTHVPLKTIGSSVYSASKAAIEQMGNVLAKECAEYGITVNNLGLSYVKNTGMVENLNENVIMESLTQTIFKRKLDYNDVINALDFFISNKSKMVTSQTIYLGGV